MTTQGEETNQLVTVTQTFRQFVESRMLALDFNKLPETLSCGIRKTTTVLKHPRRMKLAMIQKLNEALNGELLEVIDQYQIGYDVLKIEEYKALFGQD